MHLTRTPVRLAVLMLASTLIACGGGRSPIAMIRPDVTTTGARFIARLAQDTEVAHTTFLYRESEASGAKCPESDDVRLEGEAYASDGWTSVQADPPVVAPEAPVYVYAPAAGLASAHEYIVCVVATVDDEAVLGQREKEGEDTGGNAESRQPLTFRTLPGGPPTPARTAVPATTAPPPPPAATPSASPSPSATPTSSPAPTPVRTATATPKASTPAPAPPPPLPTAAPPAPPTPVVTPAPTAPPTPVVTPPPATPTLTPTPEPEDEPTNE